MQTNSGIHARTSATKFAGDRRARCSAVVWIHISAVKVLVWRVTLRRWEDCF
jgi:hypothetical protein